MSTPAAPRITLEAFEERLTHRIHILDGAMGTMTQAYKLSEAEVRGK